jgi:hypothetical protein
MTERVPIQRHLRLWKRLLKQSFRSGYSPAWLSALLLLGLSIPFPVLAEEAVQPSATLSEALSPSLSITRVAPSETVASMSDESPEAKMKPSVVTLAFGNGLSQDMEIIQWPDGSFSVPVKAMTALFGIEAQQSATEKRLFFIDSVTHNKVDLYWEQFRLTVNEQAVRAGAHRIVHNTNGLLVPDDVYLDQAVFSRLLDATFSFDRDTTTLTLLTKRKLKTSNANVDDSNPILAEINTTVIRNPEIVRSLVEKLYIRNTSTYMRQQSLPATSNGNGAIYSLIDTPTLKLSGTLFGQEYYIQPALTRYNSKLSFQSFDWSIQHPFQNQVLSLGSTDAGLSPLTSPTLNLWGLKLASHNAQTPFLMPKTDYEFSGKVATGNQVTIMLNNRALQTVTSSDDNYEFEPVALEPQALNHIRILEKDRQNQEKVLLDKTIPAFHNLLPKGEFAYSGFIGRRAVSFYPLLADTKTPLFLPQSEKWLTGGRVFYGVGNRLTLGFSGAADRIWGTPKTYYNLLNPLSVDLNGFTSYQRDSNFFNGENLSATLRYQMRDRWLLSLDSGLSHFNLKSGSLLSIPSSNTGKALQLHIERQGDSFSWFADAFHYDPYYYTPSVTLYGNALYDRQGIGTGIQGTIPRIPSVSYHLGWSHYRTNLERLIPGGVINADRLDGNITTRLGSRTNLALSLNGIRGLNRDREFLQRSIDLALQTRALPWGLTGEVRTSHYFTNTLFYPARAVGATLSESPYTNNILYTSLELPLTHSKRQRIKVGNQLSTFFDDWFVQGSFQIKQLFFEPLLQRSYGNRPQTQNRMGLRLGYEFKSGSRLSVAYYKNDSSFNVLSGSGTQSSNNTHQFYFDFTDILGLLAHHPRSLGPNADTQALIIGTVFVDYYNDGKRDKSEPGVHNVKLMVDKQQVALSDKSGTYLLTGLSSGYHTIEVLPDDLPLTLSTENPIYKVKLTSGKTHRINIGLLPEGGVIKGRLALVNDDGKALDPKNLILVLTNSEGRTLNYTSIGEDGSYKFSNIPAGRYHIDLEEKLKDSGRYRILKSPSVVDLKIPQNYEDINEVKHQDFQVLAL